ncbi:preprotein translocase subunit SecG [Chelativorans sp. M5D2P16]|uniref:preprotein translocase subunit SecG n=1 Tax=Chelativorans sp. M5D2P16 TaxID=3095678 RepID=UPI002ACAD1EC|nr:preprotein translocase subunit SecG [Chelativorans sp. M5D2P16]MDZ5697747.1 preprotein translocase subunit SecG [Chelativorans sp. M5D2P16]
MQTIIIVIHLLVVIALVGTVLMQRSEGGGLGIGGGSGFMSARGAANALTRTTAILAAAFFATSLALSLIARYQGQPTDIFDTLPASETQQEDGGGAGILDELGGGETPAPPTGTEAQPAPAGEQPAPTQQPGNPEPRVPTGE